MRKPSRLLAVIESLLVTIIWASSFVFVKMGLAYMGPLTVAGLRYFFGALLILPFIARSGGGRPALPRGTWVRLLLIGLSAYTIGNGAMNWSLKYLSATTASFLLSLVPILVLAAGIVWLKEIPSPLQVLGVLITVGGSALFFAPGLQGGEWIGIGLVAIGLIAFTLFGILGREAARAGQIGTLLLAAAPLAMGGGLLLLVALPLEGLPPPAPPAWGIVLWLAVVNTAIGYVLYYHSLQVLTALEMNVMLNLSPLCTALMAALLLAEKVSVIQVVGIVTVIGGVLLVQHRRARPALDSVASSTGD